MQNFFALDGGVAPIRMFLHQELLDQTEPGVFTQARNTANTLGVDAVCVLPDCHHGYGAPIGSVVTSRTRIIPGPVGFDIGCGMAVYLTDVPAEALKDRLLRRRVMDAIDAGIAMGHGKWAIHGIDLTDDLIVDVVNEGAPALAHRGLVPEAWTAHCERSVHPMPDGQPFRLDEVPTRAARGFDQLGTLGGGNHFIELQEIRLPDEEALRAIATRWSLWDGQLAIMVHSGSRGFGHGLGEWAFSEFKRYNEAQGEPFLDKELVHAPVDSELGRQYMRFVAAGANYALCNRLLMARVVKQCCRA